MMSHGICPSSSLFVSGHTRIGANAHRQPTTGVSRLQNLTSLASAVCRRALKYRVSDQDGAAAAGSQTAGHPTIGFRLRKQNGKAAVSGSGMNSHGDPPHPTRHGHLKPMGEMRTGTGEDMTSEVADKSRTTVPCRVVAAINRRVQDVILTPRERLCRHRVSGLSPLSHSPTGTRPAHGRNPRA